MAKITLDNMEVGSRGTIIKIDAKGPLNRRIRDMGVNPGTEILLEGKAPLGDPIHIKVNNLSLALRISEANQIIIECQDQIKKDVLKIALAGNPNCGKTTLFNGITGAHQHVGNYPGVTVEKKIGHLRMEGKKFEFIDLPGTYSLSAYSEDEVVARNFIVTERPDLIINVIDASNLERNLYLTVQLMEMNVPVIMALNMEDVAKKCGIKVNIKKLSELLNIPVIPTTGHKQKGIKELLENIKELSKSYVCSSIKKVSYGMDIDQTLNDIELLSKENSIFKEAHLKKFNPSWFLLKLVESDEEIIKIIDEIDVNKTKLIKEKIEQLEKHIDTTLDDTPENVISGYRYGFSASIVKQCSKRNFISKKSSSDKIDAILTHRVLGPVALLLILWLSYQFIFTASEYPTSIIESFFSWLHNLGTTHIPVGLLQSLLVSGIVDGVGGVLGFTPLIMAMFLLIAFIEDSGYMARIAFNMDRVLKTFGMHGNSILAFIVSGGIAGGCAVPGIMATRTLRDPNERLATILTVPFMNCGAKLPVFALLIAAFFNNNKGLMMFFITIISWIIALFIAGLLRKTLLRGEATPFVMELPPYRLPTFKGLVIHTWERTWLYVKKAGTFILAAAIIMWALMTFPNITPPDDASLSPKQIASYKLEHSIAGRVGKKLEVVTKPLTGFGWKTNISLIGGMAAKEIIVSTMATANSLGNVEVDKSVKLSEKLKKNPNWNPLIAFALLLFIMLYSPCIAVLATIRKETNSYKWPIFSFFYTSAVAFIFSTLIYQVGSFFKIGI